MNAMWSEAKARVSHRLATHLSVGPFRLLDETPGVSFAFDDLPKSAVPTAAQTYNGWLISPHPRRHRSTRRVPLLVRADEPCPGGGIETEKPGSEHGGGSAMRGRLNAFFAISVNSPSMSMVNFCCCVCSALYPRARCVMRRVAPQPVRAAVRMKAGDHVCP